VTELNTIPGSMSYYLWEAFGIEYPALIDRLVKIAENQATNKKRIITSFESNILEKQA
jgi:D-alanine-D-alanine ligase